MLRTLLYVHVYIILDFLLTYRNTSVVFSLLKVMKIPTQKGEHSCKYTELSLLRKEGIVNFLFIYSNWVNQKLMARVS